MKALSVHQIVTYRHAALPIGNARAVVLVAAGFIAAAPLAHATAIVVSDPYLQYYNVGPNDLDFTSGELIRYGANGVVPNGSGGTTGVATTTNLSTGGTITRTMVFEPSGVVLPNFFYWDIAVVHGELFGNSQQQSCQFDRPLDHQV